MLGNLSKMHAQLASPIQYQLPVGKESVPLNDFLGKTFEFRYTGSIHCTHCSRKTKKSFNQGYCYPCFKKLAQCDTCIIKPEQCHFDHGTCREPQWAEDFCFQPHYVYLANSSGLKVGITRENQIPTRWIDQGAVQALPIVKVQSRYQSGLIEIAIARHIADKTNWRTMLKGLTETLDLEEHRQHIFSLCSDDFSELQEKFGSDAIELLTDEKPITLDYPVLEYPAKVTSMNLDKNPEVTGTLLGIKGQYLMFDTGVINIRKFTGYEVEL